MVITEPDSGSEQAATTVSGRALLLVAVLAALVQGAYLLTSRDDPTFATPIVDAGVYHESAMRFARGERLIDDAFWQPPFFPWTLGFLYRVMGVNVVAARVVLALLAVATCTLVARIGMRLFGTGVGVAGGIGLALYGPYVFLSTQLVPTGLVIFLLAVAIVLWIEHVETRRNVVVGACGFLCGLAIITVPNAVVLALVVVGKLIWRAMGERRAAAVIPAAIFMATTATAVAPVTLRNYLVSGDFVLISTNGGINFYIGNNPDMDQTLAIRPGEPWKRLARASYAFGARSRLEQGQHFFARGLHFAREQPGAFVSNMARKTLHYCHATELPRNVDPYTHREYSSVLSVLMWRAGPIAFPFSLVAVLSAAGMALSLWNRSPCATTKIGRRSLIAFVILYAASVVLFFVSARHRLPGVVWLLPFAAYGAVELARAVGSGRRRPQRIRGLRAAIAISCACLVVTHLPIRFPTDGYNFHAEILMCVGHRLYEQGRVEDAEAMFRKALEENPTYAEAAGRLAAILANRARVDEAVELLRRASTWDTRSAELRVLLGRILRDAGDETALQVFQSAVAVDPTDEDARKELADVLARAGRLDEAAEQLRATVGIAESPGPVLIMLGDTLAEAGQYAEAIDAYRRGLWLVEPDAPTLARVARLLVTCPDDALRDCERAIDLAGHAATLTEFGDADVLDTLAGAYAQCGLHEDSLITLERALAVAMREGDAAAKESLERRLEELRRSVKMLERPVQAPATQHP
jgi:tetratricopeptide (TPR) repeat protein